ncbi:DUF4249 domain-containing protein [Sphingobacterium spiritivorum]|uniref:DUF4249 domain-containing protein n=1 Tax=Sphingobacterium spiritivorum TaxID=258 RepID=UPI003DA2CD27
MQRIYYIVLLFSVLLVSCEDKIDINLNDASPKVVIVGDLSNLSDQHQIRVSKTIAFNQPANSIPVNNATVQVTEVGGRTYTFQLSDQNGNYSVRNMQLRVGRSYKLSVTVEGQLYESVSSVPPYVEVEKFGLKEESIFGDIYKYVVFTFTDPVGVENYYRYLISVNKKKMEFAAVLSDKFNDGLSVSHDIANEDNDLFTGDEVVIRRQCIDKGVYRYWNDFQLTNPGSASPANPTSNITNGALGYFSTSSAKEYSIIIE